MRSFDPRRVGHLECSTWVAYYRRDWPAFLHAAVALTRHSFGLPWPTALRGAWWVLAANRAWAPFPQNDPAAARRSMLGFYRLVAARHGEEFDLDEAARLEVDWWRIHREHQHDPEAPGTGPLAAALAALYSHVYGVEADDVLGAAVERARAMAHSDAWVAEGCDPASPLIVAERAALVRSYAALLSAVHRV